MQRLIKQALYKGLKKCQRSDFHRILDKLRYEQYQPFAYLQEERSILLSQLLKEAYCFSPFYHQRLKETGISFKGGFDIDLWNTIPPLTRADVLTFQSELLHRNAEERGMFFSGTGGSTASPVFIAHDKYCKDWIQASYFFINEWSDLQFGMPYFLLWASEFDLKPQQKSLVKRFIMGYLQGRRILDTAIVNDAVHQKHIYIINTQTDCHHIMAYANEAHALACYSLENNLPILRPLKAVYTTAATLTDKMRKTIEEAFHCKVLNRYGSREAGDIACECFYQQGLHINPMNLKIEVVDNDNQPIDYGKEGRILLTSLHNYSMPLIRYDIGDRGIMRAPERCRCGREWESLECLTGRVAEKIVLAKGEEFNGIFIEEAFDNVPNLQKYQVHQVEADHLQIKLRSSIPNFVETYQNQLQTVTQLLQKWTNTSLKIEYEQTNDFERTLSGKELTIVSKLNRNIPSSSLPLN